MSVAIGLVTRFSSLRPNDAFCPSATNLSRTAILPPGAQNPNGFGEAARGVGDHGQYQVQHNGVEGTAAQRQRVAVHDGEVVRCLVPCAERAAALPALQIGGHREDSFRNEGQILPSAGSDEQHALARAERQAVHGTSTRLAERRDDEVVQRSPEGVTPSFPAAALSQRLLHRCVSSASQPLRSTCTVTWAMPSSLGHRLVERAPARRREWRRRRGPRARSWRSSRR